MAPTALSMHEDVESLAISLNLGGLDSTLTEYGRPKVCDPLALFIEKVFFFSYIIYPGYFPLSVLGLSQPFRG